jgi:hypothetical protein
MVPFSVTLLSIERPQALAHTQVGLEPEIKEDTAC